ncbi:MAG: hypothetical protein HUK20_12235, partial [Fibrobacter sp.]|nr:hypothetical protein [Fibrobacter sp.]
MNKVLLSGLLLLLVACNDEVVKPNPQEADSSSGSLLSSSSDEVDEESTVPVSSSSLSSSSEAVSKISSSSAQANGSVGCKPTTVAGFTTWCGDTEKNPSHVSTGLDNGNGKSGYWSFYNDNSDGGLSLIKWHCDLVPTWSIDQLEPIIDDCGGLCGTFALDNGSLDYNPFVGVGFAVAGYYYVDPSTADASEWDGLCVAYSSDLDMTLELSLGADGDKELAYDIPSVSLQKSSLGTV